MKIPAIKVQASGRCSRISAADKIRAAEKATIQAVDKAMENAKPAVRRKVIPHDG